MDPRESSSSLRVLHHLRDLVTPKKVNDRRKRTRSVNGRDAGSKVTRRDGHQDSSRVTFLTIPLSVLYFPLLLFVIVVLSGPLRPSRVPAGGRLRRPTRRTEVRVCLLSPLPLSPFSVLTDSSRTPPTSLPWILVTILRTSVSLPLSPYLCYRSGSGHTGDLLDFSRKGDGHTSFRVWSVTSTQKLRGTDFGYRPTSGP